MPIAKLKLVGWKPQYECLKMRKKMNFLYLLEGFVGEELQPGGALMWRLNFSSTATYQNLGPFQDMLPQKVPQSNGIAQI